MAQVVQVQYSQYSVWRRELLGAETDPASVASRQITYWNTELAGLEQLMLPTDRPRPREWTYGAGRETCRIDARTHRALLTLTHHQHASLFTALRSALAMLLARLSGDRDIAFGTPVAGRGDPALDDVVGMFVNTIVLRTRLEPGMSFAEIVDQSRDVELRAFAQFEWAGRGARSAALALSAPVLPGRIVVEQLHPCHLDRRGVALRDQPSAPRPLDIAKCDLHFHFTERHSTDGQPDGIAAELVYSTDLFDAATVRSVLATWQAVLAEITT